MTEQLSTLAEATLNGGMSIVFEAIDPSTGAVVTGVVVSRVAILAETVDAGLDGQVQLDDSDPQWQPIALEDQA